MKGIVLCPKEQGNTYTLCKAIVETDSRWQMQRLTGSEDIDLSSFDLVVVGSGVYGGRPHTNLVHFLEGLPEKHAPKELHVLLTWVGRVHSNRTTFKYIKQICSDKGIAVSDTFHSCFGHSFGILWPSRPNESDKKACIAWATSLFEN
ncbi:hypothetical protein [Sphaerochaeta sp. UBA5856]|jgi:menaquinone-dependent protoporphyrinogen IX oxidase|uniref:hypothetical protein n=1 Tax=Sphaerochaeta sp. UBA5856 TaxID=1947476 RepID=UPI0025E5572D|nr:hypothetical protein [Sphaerochaeta sp. UBA5856]